MSSDIEGELCLGRWHRFRHVFGRASTPPNNRGSPSVGSSPIKQLGDFLKHNNISDLLDKFPKDMPLKNFIQIGPAELTKIAEPYIREKVIHAVQLAKDHLMRMEVIQIVHVLYV